jgi:hypothetical protein
MEKIKIDKNIDTELDVKYLNISLGYDDAFKAFNRNYMPIQHYFHLVKNGYDELWYIKDPKGFGVIISVGKNGNIELYDYFKDKIKKIRNIEKYNLKDSLPIVLEPDAILEKIHKYGIDMITKEEKDFLDNSF